MYFIQNKSHYNFFLLLLIFCLFTIVIYSFIIECRFHCNAVLLLFYKKEEEEEEDHILDFKMTSVLDSLVPKPIEETEDLAAKLEALPSYENLKHDINEPAVFNDEQEPSTGLIELIRRNSHEGEPSNIV